MKRRNIYRTGLLLLTGILTSYGMSSCCSKRIMVKYGSPQSNYQQQPEKEKAPIKEGKGTEIAFEKA